MKLLINCDGGARGNPGPAAIGVVIANKDGSPIKKYAQAIGLATNNEAEYGSAIFALKKAKQLFGKRKAKETSIEIRTDSELVVKHLNHQYKIQEKNLQELFFELWNLMLDFREVKFVVIPRSKNKEADRLVNQALDSKTPSLF